jgi:pimeloyl-ACP methyl ester carboxylesterase
MGGLITMTVAALRPAVVAGTVLNDVGPKLSPVGLSRIAGYAGQVKTCETWEQAASSMRTVNQSAFPDLNQTDWLAFAHRTFQPAPGGGLRPSCDPDISAPIKAMAAAPPTDLTPFFTGLATGRPTLLVRGELSDLIDAKIAGEMRRLAPDMDYAEVPRVGHAPMLTEPRALEALAAWLDKAP